MPPLKAVGIRKLPGDRLEVRHPARLVRSGVWLLLVESKLEGGTKSREPVSY